jgi:hypothetical protein
MRLTEWVLKRIGDGTDLFQELEGVSGAALAMAWQW